MEIRNLSSKLHELSRLDLPGHELSLRGGSRAVPVSRLLALKPPEGTAAADGWQRLDVPEDVRQQRLGLLASQGDQPPRSVALEILGKDRLVSLPAIHVPGRLLWVNFELARQLGFDVPPTNQLTPQLQQQLLEALAVHLAPNGVVPQGQEALPVYADRYGGDHIGKNKGSGRAAFLPERNICIKGIGVTPLVGKDADFGHSHGGSSLQEGIREAIWGEVNQHLFEQGSTRVLALIDINENTDYANGVHERRVLIARAGQQIRPAHLLESAREGGRFSKDVFLAATAQSGDLVVKPAEGGEVQVDVAQTMRRLIEHHAHVAAEQFRWRILHGGMSASNMELSAGQLDFGTETAQPRTAPIRFLPYTASFAEEAHVRAVELARAYDILRESMGLMNRGELHADPLEVEGEFEAAYQRHLQRELLQAAGLSSAVADRTIAARPQAAKAFTEALERLAAMPAPGPLEVEQGPQAASLVDIFHLLQSYPDVYFAAPQNNHVQEALDLLQPNARALKAVGVRPQLRQLAHAFVATYRELMQTAARESDALYPTHAEFEAAVKVRARFQNQPLDELYYSALQWRILQTRDAYVASGDPTGVQRTIDEVIAHSMRDFESLLRQGEARRLDQGWELERKVIQGVEYRIRVDTQGAATLVVSLPVEAADEGRVRIPAGDGLVLEPAALEQLRYRFTLDGWSTNAEALGQPVGGDGTPGRLEFGIDLGAGPRPIQVSGLFRLAGADGVDDRWLHDRGGNFDGYVAAVPGLAELRALPGGQAAPTAAKG